jgi:hypothetical protein
MPRSIIFMKKPATRFHKGAKSAFAVATLAALVFSLLPTWQIASAADVPGNKADVSTFAFRKQGGLTYSVVATQPTGAGDFSNGSVAGYPEGACIPFVIELANNWNSAGDISVTLVHDYDKSGTVGVDQLEEIAQNAGTLQDLRAADDLDDVAFTGSDLTSLTSVALAGGGSASAVVTGPFSGDEGDGNTPVSPGDENRHYFVTVQNIPSGDTAYLYFCGRLGVDASEFPGASLSIGVSPPSGGVENTAIQVNQILALPSITLTKIVSGGTATADEFSFTVDGNEFVIADGEDTVVVENVSPDGAHSIVESGPADYIFQSGEGTNCVFDGQGGATATVAAGKPASDAVCTFTNVYEEPEALPAYIHITKTFVNDDGSTAAAEDFAFFIGEDSAALDTDIEVAPGSYAVSELTAGLSPVATHTVTFGGDCDAQGNVTATAGVTASCTIENNDLPAFITVYKDVVNSEADPSSFELFVDESIATIGEAVQVGAGAHQVSETAVVDYVTTFSGDCNAEGQIDAVNGAEYSCTVTNTYVEPIPGTGTITVIKQVENSQVSPSSFTLYVSSDEAFDESDVVASGDTNEYEIGTYYVGEEWVEDFDSSFSESCAEGVIELAEGDNVVCTITNTYVAPPPTTGTIKVVKTVVNDDAGESEVSDFSFFVGESEVENDAAQVFAPGEYVVTETGPEGYAATFGGDCDAEGGIILSAGQDLVCTITNDDVDVIDEEDPDPIMAYLTVIKQVINDNGGEAEVADFDLFVDETQVSSGETLELAAGSYVVSESFDAGYLGSFSGSCDGNGLVNLSEGEEAVCTITNNDIQQQEEEEEGGGGGGGGGGGSSYGYVTVVTVVINDDGGTLTPSHFLMQVTDGGYSVYSAFGGIVSPGLTSTAPPGAYAVLAEDDAAYEKTMSSNCTGSVSSGQTVVCVVTYDDIAPAVSGPSEPPAPPAEPTPEPLVLGVTDETPTPLPEPMVLGVTDEQLPRTGLVVWPVALLAAAFAAVGSRRRA